MNELEHSQGGGEDGEGSHTASTRASLKGPPSGARLTTQTWGNMHLGPREP